ncbi:unnamed protein product [Acanthoscelides obtectus]|uniref:Uncharacterized protein n=1 Tax=Acanthoscelides obtectus TaxID=200917 RepID=A0A9P0NXP8_ACAOB|nr:unnamed protein product [Acanthoscelides obtectus]CAK1663956.1 SCAN domain-containing protein 3 [Acanthoscelides obtectus]
MKPSKLQDHLRRCHPDKTEKDLKYFQTLKDKFQKGPTLDRMFASTSQRNNGLRASYNISLLIAKSGKPHTIGEKLILLAVEEVLKTVLHKPASDIIKRIPLSNNTVERRIDEMSSDIESFLCNYLQTSHFSIQLDESTLPDNAALSLAYVHFIMNQETYEELLFARTLMTDTKEFLDTKDKILKENLMKRKTDIAYLKTKSILSAFLARVKLMKQNIGRGEFSQFPNLSQTSCQEDVSTYVQHLNALCSDFESRFEDILTMVIPPWIINPYGDIEETNVIIQEELTELSTNEELKVQFKYGYQQFWLQNNIPVTYPIVDSAEYIFPMRGHSFLPNDSDFASIEKKKRRLERAERPEDWVKVILNARMKPSPFYLVEVKQYDFFDIKSATSNYFLNNSEPAIDIKNIRILRITSQTSTLFLKDTYNGPFQITIVAQSNLPCTIQLERHLNELLPVASNKAGSLKLLLPLLRFVSNKEYYERIHDNNTPNSEIKEYDDSTRCAD